MAFFASMRMISRADVFTLDRRAQVIQARSGKTGPTIERDFPTHPFSRPTTGMLVINGSAVAFTRKSGRNTRPHLRRDGHLCVAGVL